MFRFLSCHEASLNLIEVSFTFFTYRLISSFRFSLQDFYTMVNRILKQPKKSISIHKSFTNAITTLGDGVREELPRHWWQWNNPSNLSTPSHRISTQEFFFFFPFAQVLLKKSLFLVNLLFVIVFEWFQ